MKVLAIFSLLVASVYCQGNIVEELESLGLTETARYVSYTPLQNLLETVGPITLFAPTNDAWAAVDEDIVFILENNYDVLELVLRQHMILGEEVDSGDLSNELLKNSYNEVPIRFNVYANGAVTASGAKITVVDQKASNGVIHSLALPMETPVFSLTAEVQDDIDLSVLSAALFLTGLDETLDGEEPLTLFAPDDDAFENLPEGVLEDLLLDPEALSAVLQYHVVAGTQFSAGLTSGNYTTLAGADIEIIVNESGVTVNGNAVSQADTAASNGAMHIVDGVLLPPSDE